MSIGARGAAFVTAVLLAACSSGGGIPNAPTSSSPSALQYSWHPAGSSMVYPDTPILFDPWVGTWPNVTLEHAIVTIIGAPTSSTVQLTPTANCVSVSAIGPATFDVVQGNNGLCVLVASAGPELLPIIADAGYPEGVPFTIDYAGQSVSRPLETTLGTVLDLSVMLTILPSHRAPSQLSVTSYGGCVSAPAVLKTNANPISLLATAIATGSCFLVISNGDTGSDLVQFTIPH